MERNRLEVKGENPRLSGKVNHDLTPEIRNLLARPSFPVDLSRHSWIAKAEALAKSEAHQSVGWKPVEDPAKGGEIFIGKQQSDGYSEP